MKFKVGDRVAVFGYTVASQYFNGEKGMIKHIEHDCKIQIELEHTKCLIYAHPKQCRRLKKKKRRVVWVRRGAINIEIKHITTIKPIGRGSGEWIKFIEARNEKDNKNS